MRTGWERTICVASGPSLTLEQCEFARKAQCGHRCRIVVVNDNWRRIPSAAALYACDGPWWSDVQPAKGYIPIAGHEPRSCLGISNAEASRIAFWGERWTQDQAAAVKFGLQWIKPVRGNHLVPLERNAISNGSNSGFQAIMLARLWGAKKIALAGFDMSASHWFGDHANLPNGSACHMASHFDAVAPALAAEGIDVVNCSIATNLTCFRRGRLEEEI